MTPETLEYEIRQLDGVFSCSITGSAVAILAGPSADADAIAANAQTLVAIAGVDLEVVVIGGIGAPVVAPLHRLRKPAAAGAVVGIGSLLAAAMATAMTGGVAWIPGVPEPASTAAPAPVVAGTGSAPAKVPGTIRPRSTNPVPQAAPPAASPSSGNATTPATVPTSALRSMPAVRTITTELISLVTPAPVVDPTPAAPPLDEPVVALENGFAIVLPVERVPVAGPVPVPRPAPGKQPVTTSTTLKPATPTLGPSTVVIEHDEARAKSAAKAQAEARKEAREEEKRAEKDAAQRLAQLRAQHEQDRKQREAHAKLAAEMAKKQAERERAEAKRAEHESRKAAANHAKAAYESAKSEAKAEYKDAIADAKADYREAKDALHPSDKRGKQEQQGKTTAGGGAGKP